MAVNIKKDFGDSRNRKPDITSLVYGKVPPQVPELEEAVLGAMLLEKDKQDEVLSIIPSPDCFYVDANQKVYEAIIETIRLGCPVDLLTVTETLRKMEQLEIVGGAYYLTRLTMAVSSSAHVEAHARIVMEKFIGREIIRISGSAVSDAYDDSTDVFDLLDRVETNLMELHQQKQGTGKTLLAIARANSISTEEHRRSNKVLTGLDTGFAAINRVTNGWQNTDLIILAARPAVGKTSLMLSFAKNCGKPVAIFSLEMPAAQLEKRLRSAESGIPMDKLNAPYRMSDDDFTAYLAAEQTIARLPIIIDDKGGRTIMELRAKARKLKAKNGIEMILIDYLQLMSGEGDKGTNREQEISAISRGLKALAKELEIPIIALSQLNREVESRKPPKPRVSDLRESGAIEQDADVIMLGYRASAEDENKDPMLAGPVFIDFAKNRNGTTEEITLHFQRNIQRWSDFNETPQFVNHEPFGGPENHYKFLRNSDGWQFGKGNDNNEDVPY